jgi:GTP pyrophosphokinase
LNGKNSHGGKKGWRKLVPFLGRGKQQKKEAEEQPELFIVPEKFNRKKPIYITDDNIRQYLFKHCCHPIPGDDILGYIDNKNQIEIHKRACPVADKLKSGFGNRILDAKWNMHKKLFFDATVRIQGIDRMGILVDVSRVITSQMNVNIHKLTIGSDDGLFDGSIELRVHDREDTKSIMDELKKIEGIQEVTQIM